MHRFYVKKKQIQENQIKILGEDVNHICNVLRMKVGKEIVVCDEQGTDYYCTIHALGKEEVVAEIVSRKDTETELTGKIYLFQGIPKKDKMDWIVQKAVELGVYEIIPVAMKRCVAKIEDGKKERKKIERWQAIANAAAKQSGRGLIPQIQNVCRFPEALEKARELECVIIPYEQAECMEKSKKIIADACKTKSVGIFIGPEGGFDEEEIALALEKDFQTVTLGKRILRTETAGMTILSLLMFGMEQ
ncbi:MAG: 16S rRNA (uracil(1498)-N(3))-methyltransferase [Lachnospiraceae bacterium]|nr:16S rRNA (uracil(1498)-N(3))-methyltransferase [Lachnospiraceae bacterium]